MITLRKMNFVPSQLNEENMVKSISKLLQDLGIKAKNESICTGREWITSLGTEIKDVVTPVTGEKLAQVVYASQSEYEHVIKKRKKQQHIGKQYLPRNVAISYANMETN